MAASTARLRPRCAPPHRPIERAIRAPSRDACGRGRLRKKSTAQFPHDRRNNGDRSRERHSGPQSMKIAVPDLISNSYFPAVAAVELGFFAQEGIGATLELIFPVDRAYQALAEGTVDLVAG